MLDSAAVMEKTLEEKLNIVLAAHKTAKEKAEMARQTAQKKQDAFVAAFQKLRKDVVRPAMEEMGRFIEEKGFQFDILERDDGLHSPSIRWTLFVDGQRGRIHDHAGLTVSCEETKERILFHKSTMNPGSGGMSGPDGEVGLSEVTKDFIQQKIASIVAEVFR